MHTKTVQVSKPILEGTARADCKFVDTHGVKNVYDIGLAGSILNADGISNDYFVAKLNTRANATEWVHESQELEDETVVRVNLD